LWEYKRKKSKILKKERRKRKKEGFISTVRLSYDKKNPKNLQKIGCALYP